MATARVRGACQRAHLDRILSQEIDSYQLLYLLSCELSDVIDRVALQ
jgi:hypothetical protein